MSWDLTYSGTTKTLAEWGITQLVRRRSSQAVDVVSFVLEGLDFDADAPFAANQEVVITKDSVGWFRGRITGQRRDAVGAGEQISYEVAGPWWYLARLVYQQTWTIYGVGPVYKSHCLLNTWADGNAMNTQDQMDDILEWAKTKAQAAFGAAPFQWTKANLPSIQIPSDEVRDITCEEAFRKQLRWLPDAVAWFDYSTNPPTFHCARRASLSTVSVPVGAPMTAVALVPRYDLQVPSVVIKFEQVNTVDSATWANVIRQNYPPAATGEEFGALCATIDLQGWSISSISASVKVGTLPSTATDWWEWLKLKHPTLASSRVSLTEVLSFSRAPSEVPSDPTLPRELLGGQVAPWMGYSAQDETVKFRIQYAILNPSGTYVVESKDEEFAINIKTTDAITGTFTTVGEVIAGEDPPSGLAQALYDALSVLEWAGSVTFQEEEIGGTVGIGTLLRITGGRTEWTTMDAMVQEVVEDVESGTTTVSVGPPQHLGARDIVELLRIGRFRHVFTPAAARASGAATSGTTAGLGDHTPKENASAGPADRTLLRVGTIILDAADTDGVVLRVREVDVCVDGVPKTMLLLASEPY